MAGHDLDDDDEGRGLPLVVYVVVGVLAVIGFFSIIGAVMGAVFWIVKVALAVALALVVVWVIRTLFFGSSRRADV
jgi:uncharacterized membrane protein